MSKRRCIEDAGEVRPSGFPPGVGVFRHMCTFMAADSLFNLADCCRDLQNRCDVLRRECFLSKRVSAALGRRGLDDELLEAMRLDKGILTGSLLLQALTGETWESSDVDMMSAEPSWLNVQALMIHRKVESALYEGPEKQRYMGHGIIVQAAFYPSTGLQLLLTGAPTVEETICGVFDLDFLKNAFDGRTLVIHKKHAVARRESPYHVASAGTMEYKVVCWFSQHHGKRCLKYHDRGFRIRDVVVRSEKTVPYSSEYPSATVRTVMLHDRKAVCSIEADEAKAMTPLGGNYWDFGHFGTVYLRDLVEFWKSRLPRSDIFRMVGKFLVDDLPRGVQDNPLKF